MDAKGPALFLKPCRFMVLRSRLMGRRCMPPQPESRAGRPHGCPGSFREQGAHLPVGHVQRYLLIVQPRRNVAGGIDVRVQHNPVGTVEPIPATRALQQTVRESICDVKAELPRPAQNL